MPVEIRELIIRASVDDTTSQNADQTVKTPVQKCSENDGALDEKIIRQIVDQLKRRKER